MMRKQLSLFFGFLALLLCLFSSSLAQEKPLVTSGITESNISLTIEIHGTEYKKGEIVQITYRVQNKGKQNIYLVTGLESQLDGIMGYDPDKRWLGVILEKSILTYHYFEYPKMQKLRPNKTYVGTVNLPLLPSWMLREEKDRRRFVTGEWLLNLSIGYLDNEGMAEISDLLKRWGEGGLAQPFQKAQKIISTGPIQIKIADT